MTSFSVRYISPRWYLSSRTTITKQATNITRRSQNWFVKALMQNKNARANPTT
jgi:hypothetical protein